MKKIILFTLIAFMALSVKAQLNESFEGSTFPPAGWATFTTDGDKDFDNVDWEISERNVHAGLKSAYSGWYDDVEEGWLVTPQITPTNSNHTLYFFQSQFDEDDDYDSVFTVRVSTASQTTITDFTIVDTQTEDDFTETFSRHSVDLSAYIGTPIYIAFVHDTNEDGDNWYIDDITFDDTIEVPDAVVNPTPANNATNVSIVNAETTRIDLSWENAPTGGTPLSYRFYAGLDAANLHFIAYRDATFARPKRFHFNTTYYWKAVAVNMAGEATGTQTWSFTTAPQPVVTAPITFDFENNGFIPDGCDQLTTNTTWWKFKNTPTSHMGNAGNIGGTSTDSNNYFMYVDDTSTNGQTASFVTPFIDVSSINQLGLSFYMISDNEGETNVDFSIELWNGTTWTEVFSSNTNTAGWELKDLDLSSYTITGNAQLKFKVSDNNSGYKDDLAIDDIKIYDKNPTGIEDATLKTIFVYPNPANNIITISSNEDIQKLTIYDITGREITNHYSYKKLEKINIEVLPSGTYFISVSTKTINKLIKFEKK